MCDSQNNFSTIYFISAVKCLEDNLPYPPLTSNISISDLEDKKTENSQNWNSCKQNVSYFCPDNYIPYYQGQYLDIEPSFQVYCDIDAHWRITSKSYQVYMNSKMEFNSYVT